MNDSAIKSPSGILGGLGMNQAELEPGSEASGQAGEAAR